MCRLYRSTHHCPTVSVFSTGREAVGSASSGAGGGVVAIVQPIQAATTRTAPTATNAVICRTIIGETIRNRSEPPYSRCLCLLELFPAYFRLRALFEASDISTTSEPAVPSGIVSFGPADPVCARHLSCKGSLTPRPEVGSLRSPSYGQPELGAAYRVAV